LDLIR
jgi:hypothetical protein